jgi:pantoate--beta-alanine ligase
MKVLRSKEELKAFVDSVKENSHSLGFVPTMGALHAGHLSLLAQAKLHARKSLMSIFVNPTQFNDPEDFEKYPRNLDRDIEALHSNPPDALFIPEYKDIYPEGAQLLDFDLNGLDTVLEGAFRPGHFKGVITVVHHLLKLVEPNFLFLGEKDFQQLIILRKMIAALYPQIRVIGCPTLREPGGLAMSSRNERLSPQGRIQACQIFSTLSTIKKCWNSHAKLRLLQEARETLNQAPFGLEYLEALDAESLQTYKTDSDKADVLAVALKIEGVRLIDNIAL